MIESAPKMLCKISLVIVMLLALVRPQTAFSQVGRSSGEVTHAAVRSTSRSGAETLALYSLANTDTTGFKCFCVQTDKARSSFILIVDTKLGNTASQFGNFELFSVPSGSLATLSISLPSRPTLYVQDPNNNKPKVVFKIKESAFLLSMNHTYLLDATGISLVTFAQRELQTKQSPKTDELLDFFRPRLAEIESRTCNFEKVKQQQWKSVPFIDAIAIERKRFEELKQSLWGSEDGQEKVPSTENEPDAEQEKRPGAKNETDAVRLRGQTWFSVFNRIANRRAEDSAKTQPVESRRNIGPT